MISRSAFQWKNVFIFPILSQRLQSAIQVQNLLFDETYDLICMEYPTYLQKVFTRLCERLECLYIISLWTMKGKLPSFVPVTPEDPLAAASFLASSQGIPIRLIDHDLPKSYTYFRYFGSVKEKILPPPMVIYDDDDDMRRFRFIKRKLSKYSAKHKKILFLCHHNSFFSIKNVLEKEETLLPISPNVSKNLKVFAVHPESFYRISHELPFLVHQFYLELKKKEKKKIHFNEMQRIESKIKRGLRYLKTSEKEQFLNYFEKLDYQHSLHSSKFSNLMKASEMTLLRDASFDLKELLTFYPLFKPSRKVKTIYFKTAIDDLFDLTKSGAAESIKIVKEISFLDYFEEGETLFSTDAFYALERNVYALMKEIRRRLYDEVSFRGMDVASPIIIFSNRFNEYPKLSKSFNPLSTSLNLLFYSRQLSETYKEDNGKNFIGGICFSEKSAFPHKKPKIKQNYHYYFIEYKNTLYKNTVIPYIAKHPPSKKFIEGLPNRGNYIYYVPSNSFSFSAFMFFKDFRSLGYRRLQDIISKRK